MSSDLRRRNDESKRSVFDRLGPDTKSTSSNNNNNTVNSKISFKMPSVCPSYSKTGYCQLGSKCKYEHVRRDKEKDDTKSRIVKRTNIEKVNDHTKEAETKLKSTIVSKSSDDCDKKYRKVTETSTKTLKSSDRSSPSSDSRKRKLEDHDQTKQKGRKLGNESSKDEQIERIVKLDEKSSDKSSSKQKKSEPGVKNSSSTGSKKASHSILSPLSSSSKDGKSSEVERLPNKEIHSKGHSRRDDDDDNARRTGSKSKSDSRKDEKREPKKIVESKKDVDASVQPSSGVGQKAPRNSSPAKTKEGSKSKGKRRSASESSSSSSSSGSSSSSSGSSSGSSSRSSYTSREKSPNERRKRREVDKKSKKSKPIPEKSQKVVVKKSDDADKRSSGDKHVREHSEDGVGERSEAKRSKQKVESSQGSKRDYSKSTSPHFNSPAVKGKDDHYYSSRKHPEDRYAKVKVHNPDYERGSPERSREGRRSKADKAYQNKISPGVEVRRKEADYFRGDDFDRYNRRGDGDYESVERRKSRERLVYDVPAKDAIYDEPIRRDRLSRRGEWEQIETDTMLSKHKRHLSNESYSPTRKKKRSSPRDDYRDRSDKIYESEGRKRDYEREDDALMEDFERRRRSSHDSWHQHDKEKRQRRDKSDQERSRERGRNDYYTRSPLGSSDYSPRHRPELGKRGGDYSGYDYDVERSGRSRSRSSMGSKPAGRSRYYEGKRSLGGSSGIPSLFPPSYEYRDAYRATPEAEVMEGRGFAAKPLYWDEYKRPEGPPSGSSYRGVSNRPRPAHQPPLASGPSVDWEAGRMPGKPHEWDNRYERSSEEFLSRRDVLLPPPPRSRQENSEVLSPAPPTNSAPAIPIEVPIAPSIQPLKAMTFELEGYEEVTEEELEDCLAEEDANNDVSEKDGSQLAYEDEADSLPKKIPLVEMTDIEWESLVTADDSKVTIEATHDKQNFVEILKEVGVSKQFAGDELFEKVNLCLVDDGDDGDDDDDDDDCCGDDGDDDDKKKSKAVLVVNGDADEEKMATSEVKENGEANSTSETWSDEATPRVDPESKGRDGRIDGKENEENETFDHGLKTSTVKNERVLLHDVANFQVTAFLKKRRQASAMRDIGPYRRALCARRDLAIRRTMCRIEKDEIVMFPAQLADQELYRLSLQLFQQNGKVAQENVLLTLA